MTNKQFKRQRQIKELILIQTSMFYLTLFLEKAGVIKNNVFIDGKNKSLEDVKGAISLGKKIMGALHNVKMNIQQEAIKKANEIMIETDSKTEFNYYIFVLILLMEYKENFRNKTYSLSITYGELNTLFDDYFKVGLEDRSRMEVINDSSKIAEDFYKSVLEYGIKNSK